MKYGLKNDDGMELHIDVEERELIYNALRFYSAYGEKNNYIVEQIPKICELMNVLDMPQFNKEDES